MLSRTACSLLCSCRVWWTLSCFCLCQIKPFCKKLIIWERRFLVLLAMMYVKNLIIFVHKIKRSVLRMGNSKKRLKFAKLHKNWKSELKIGGRGPGSGLAHTLIPFPIIPLQSLLSSCHGVLSYEKQRL